MKKVLLLCGGRSEEHEISLISAKGILDGLDRSLFDPVVVGISKKGIWYHEQPDSFFLGEFRADKIRLNEDAPSVTLAPYLSEAGRGLLNVDGKIIEFDIVFPILHGQFGEDGTLQGMLDLIGVPYVGSGCGSSWICMDKVLTKTLCQQNGIAVADFAWVREVDEFPQIEEQVKQFGPPWFVKPSAQGSSVGIRKVKHLDDLEDAIVNALKYDKKCLIEQALVGREIECGVLGLNRSPKVSVPGEIIPSESIGWYSYEAKYILTDGARTITPAPLDDDDREHVQELVGEVFKLLECDGLARIDVFLTADKQVFLNEANTMPGFTPISMYPKMWEASGISYRTLISELLRLGFKRSGVNYP